jgi:hypothetical protein
MGSGSSANAMQQSIPRLSEPRNDAATGWLKRLPHTAHSM